MTTTTTETLDSVIDPDMLYWATLLSDLNTLQREITHRVTFSLDPGPAIDALELESRYRVLRELGSELAGTMTEDTVYTWLLRLAPLHTYSQRHGIDGGGRWQKVEALLQEEPTVSCIWKRDLVSEVLLSTANEESTVEVPLPLPYLKSLFEKLWIEVTGRVGVRAA